MGALKQFPKKILLVEDDRDHAFLIRKALETWLEEHKCAAVLAYTASEALMRLEDEGPFDLILSDYRLPDKTGLELLHEIKDRGLNIPLVLLTAVGDEELATKALKEGCFDYLAKSEHYIRRLPAVIQEAYYHFIEIEEEKKRRKDLADRNVELKKKSDKLAELSVQDDLTGLFNHRFLQEKFTEEFARASRYHFPLACLMIDIDHFKNINDTYGHQVGDRVLKELATSGEVKDNLLIFKTKLSANAINQKIRQYANIFVLCQDCGKPDTKIMDEKNVLFLKCQACGSKHHIKY